MKPYDLDLHAQLFKISLVLILIGILSACGRVDHEPQVGEYGQSLVNSIRLIPSEIEKLNEAVIKKPKNSFDRGKVGIGFQGDHNFNPYRFVIVAKGIAVQAGQVDLKWIGGIQSDASNGYHPQIFQDNDKHRYDINDPVLLVISSDPFSVGPQGHGLSFGAHAELMESTNFQFQSVEVQIWQGKGSHYDWTYYLKFLLIFMLVIFGIHRFLSISR